jgi:hypothetical protein
MAPVRPYMNQRSEELYRLNLHDRKQADPETGLLTDALATRQYIPVDGNFRSQRNEDLRS